MRWRHVFCVAAAGCLILALAFLFIWQPRKVPTFEPSRSGYISTARFAATRSMDTYWDAGAGYYISPVATSSLTNIMMVQAFAILAAQGELAKPDQERAHALLTKLLSPPISATAGGVSFYMDRYEEAHISVSGPFCTMLYYAWKARDSLTLTPSERQALESRVLQEMRWVRSQLFANLTGSNQTALRWGLEAASAAFRMTSLSECRRFADECLTAFARYSSSTPDALYARPWFNQDWTWVYDTTFPRQAAPSPSARGVAQSRAEYGFEYLSHCAAGVFFYQQMADGFPTEYIPAVDAILRRSLGEWVVGGYPNWITTQRDQRAFSTNYWVWSLYSLVAMTRWVGWDLSERALSRAILDGSVELFYSMLVAPADAGPQGPLQNPYDVKLYESASLNRHADLAIAMFAAYVAMAVDVDVFAVSPAPDPRVWGWEYVARNLFASTQSYGLASGSDVLSAYYQDRGDITLLYHGSGRLLTPAYVQQADPPPQWAMEITAVGADKGAQDSVCTDRSVPDAVVVAVDGREILPMPYDVTPYELGFDRVEKRSTWRRAEFSVKLVLTCLPTHIVRDVTVTPTTPGALRCTTYFPNRVELTGVECALTNGRTVPIAEVIASAVPLSGVRYIHCRYEGYGYIVIPRPAELPSSGGRIETFQPAAWDWDGGRGLCIAVTLSDGETVSEAIHLTQVIGFTDGTSQDAVRQYEALVGE